MKNRLENSKDAKNRLACLVRKALLVLGCIHALNLGALAQQNEQSAPLLRIPSSKMEWKISVVSSPDGDHNKTGVSSITITKNETVSRVVVMMKNGTRNELWRVSNCTLYWHEGRKRVFVIQDNPETSPYPYASSGFYGIERVNLSDEQSIQDFQQTKCRHFQGILVNPPSKPDGNTSEAGPASEYEAWFDLKTGLPKGYREGEKLFLYQFSASPEELRLPAEYRLAAEKNQADMRKAELLPQALEPRRQPAPASSGEPR